MSPRRRAHRRPGAGGRRVERRAVLHRLRSLARLLRHLGVLALALSASRWPVPAALAQEAGKTGMERFDHCRDVALADWDLRFPTREATTPALSAALEPIRDALTRPPGSEVRPSRQLTTPISAAGLVRDAMRLRPVHIAAAMFADVLDSGVTGFVWIAAIDPGPASAFLRDSIRASTALEPVEGVAIHRAAAGGEAGGGAQYFCVIDDVLFTSPEAGFLRRAVGWLLAPPIAEKELESGDPDARRVRGRFDRDAPFRFVVRSGALWKALQAGARRSHLSGLPGASDVLALAAFGGGLTVEDGAARFDTHAYAAEGSESIWTALEPIGSPDLLANLPERLPLALELRAPLVPLLAAISAQAARLRIGGDGADARALLAIDARPLLDTLTGRAAVAVANGAGKADPEKSALFVESTDIRRTRDALRRLSGASVALVSHEHPSGELFTIEAEGRRLCCGIVGNRLVVSSDREFLLSWMTPRPLSDRPVGPGVRTATPFGDGLDVEVGRALHRAPDPMSLWRWLVRFAFEGLPIDWIGLQNLSGPEERGSRDPPPFGTVVRRAGRRISIRTQALPRAVPPDAAAAEAWAAHMREGGRFAVAGDRAACVREFRAAYEVAARSNLGPFELACAAAAYARRLPSGDTTGERASLLSDCLERIELDEASTSDQRAGIAAMLIEEVAAGAGRPNATSNSGAARRAIESHLGTRHVLSLHARMIHGTALVAAGRCREAAGVLTPALALARECEALAPLLRLQLVDRLVAVRFERGEYEEALRLEIEALRSVGELRGAGDGATATCRMNVGRVEARMGRREESIRSLSVARTAFEAGQAGSREDVASCRLALAEAHILAGGVDEAERILDSIQAESTDAGPGLSDRNAAEAEHMRSLALLRLGRHEDARVHLSRARSASARAFGERHPRTLRLDAEIAVLNARVKEGPEAVRDAVAALGAWADSIGGQHPDVRRFASELRSLLSGAGPADDLRSALASSERAEGR